MSKDIIEVIGKLENVHHLKPATNKEIKAAEEALGLKFADDYIQYVSKYGVICASGIELTGVTEHEELSVVAVTKEEKGLDCNNIPSNMYVIENLCIDGLLALQDETGTVYTIMPYDEKPENYFDCLAAYIMRMTELDDEDE